MRAKTKKVKVSIANDRDVTEMFNQMLGEGSVNMPIAYPRYKHIGELCERTIKVFNLFAKSSLMQMPNFKCELAELTAFCEVSQKYIAVVFPEKIEVCGEMVSLDIYGPSYENTPEDAVNAFAVIYDAMKKSKFVKSLISIANNLYVYRENFAHRDKLSHKFIDDIPGVEWSPFPFPLNIKDMIYSENISENSISFIMTVICKVFEFTLAIYNEIKTPDIDVDQFIEVITQSISEIQRRPELNRCDKAFKKIKDSVMMLKTNFNEYYRDFIETQDNTIIMQNFIIDVSSNTKADPELTRQFRKIIAYYRDIAKNSDVKNSEKINSLFDKISETFKAFDAEVSNIVPIKRDDTDG